LYDRSKLLENRELVFDDLDDMMESAIL